MDPGVHISCEHWGGSIPQEAPVFSFVGEDLSCGLNHGFNILYTSAATAFAGFVPAVTVNSRARKISRLALGRACKEGANSISKF